MKPKIIDGKPMRIMSKCRFIFGHCGSSFISTVMYKSALAKIITMLGSMFRASIHFRKASTDAVYLL